MKNKYYTPSIEEFRVGFKIEVYNPDKKDWEDLTVDIGYCYGEFSNWISWGEVRVKYLDKEDIESLGFKEETIPNCFKEDSLNQGYVKHINEKESLLLHYNGETKKLFLSKQVVYNEVTDNWYTDFLFQGSIKNKSEFKVLLEQLNLLQDEG
jgi:hypothetical protein